MIFVNDFFDGKVRSLAFSMETHDATVGVMKPGEYEFNTKKKEIMMVVAGEMNVCLPDADWKIFRKGDTFSVPANVKFQLKILKDVAYLCEFID